MRPESLKSNIEMKPLNWNNVLYDETPIPPNQLELLQSKKGETLCAPMGTHCLKQSKRLNFFLLPTSDPCRGNLISTDPGVYLI